MSAECGFPENLVSFAVVLAPRTPHGMGARDLRRGRSLERSAEPFPLGPRSMDSFRHSSSQARRCRRERSVVLAVRLLVRQAVAESFPVARRSLLRAGAVAGHRVDAALQPQPVSIADRCDLQRARCGPRRMEKKSVRPLGSIATILKSVFRDEKVSSRADFSREWRSLSSRKAVAGWLAVCTRHRL